MRRNSVSAGASVVKYAANGQHAGDQERGVDQRQFGKPDARAALHIEKVEIGIRGSLRGLRAAGLIAIHEKAQGHQRALDCVGAVDPAVLDADRIGRQREADDCNTSTGAPLRVVSAINPFCGFAVCRK